MNLTDVRHARSFIAGSFRRKLILFNLAAVFLTAFAIFLFLMNRLQSITEFSLKQNSQSMEQTVQDYLNKYAHEKAGSTWLQIKAAMDNLSVLGKTAQKLVDNYDSIGAMDLSGSPLFRNQLAMRHGALSSASSDSIDIFIPPPLVHDPAARRALEVSAFLNLSIDSVFEANNNNAFIYWVGVPAVTRAYPNIDLANVLGDGIQLLFWKDWFAPNVTSWKKWFHDPALRKQFPSPVTVEAPYADAAGQGMMVTMFYPLWNKRSDQFAGAVGADITLAKIIDNILSIQVAKTGFAFLMNGRGEIIAMPEAGFKLYQVDLHETKQGGLSYYTGSLLSSKNPDIQGMAKTILANKDGLLKLDLRSLPRPPKDNSAIQGELIVYASLPALSDVNYQEDNWKIVMTVPEAEIFEALNQTHQAISAESNRISVFSIVMVLVFLVLVSIVSMLISGRVTRDLGALARAAEQVSHKKYDINLKLHSRDEIGQLGRAFTGMSEEIRGYTENLEAKVANRTADLSRANSEITRLNEQLRGENLRLGAELDVARRLQSMVLPGNREIEAISDLDIACFMRPADEVGGDYYDVLKFGESVFLGIGDVTGHGLSAGVIMLMAQTALLTLSESGEQDMKRIMSVLNQVLYKNILRINEDKNMTLAVLQYAAGEFSVVGQHESVLICRKTGKVEVVDTMDLGMPVGLDDDIERLISVVRFRLEPDDVMVLYTDGVTEAENMSGALFGMEKLCESLSRHHVNSARTVMEKIMTDLYRFIGDTKILDDISVMVIKQKEG